MTGCRRALAAAVLTLLAACAGEPASEPFLVVSGPKAFVRIELRDGGSREVWRLVADRPVALSELVYGRVPAGFRQEFPAAGAPPRELLTGEPLTLLTTTARRTFRHEGYAASPRRLVIEDWEMRLREPPPPPALDAAPAATYEDPGNAGEPARR